MAKFSYTAMDSRGKEVKGVIESENENDVLNELRKQGLFPTGVVLGDGKGGKAKGKGSGMNFNFKLPGAGKSISGGSVKPAVLSSFTRQLATLNAAGIPLLRSLNVLHKQERTPALKSIIRKMADSVEGGNTFSESVQNFPKVFNKLYVNMVKAGELGGVLEVTLTRLADFMEKAEKIKRKIKGAMFYPVAVLAIAIIIMGFLLVFIVPKFRQIFEELMPGKPMPLITEIVLGVSEFVKNQFIILVVFVAVIIIAYKIISKIPAGRKAIDKFLLKAPIFGDLTRKTSIARFTRTLGTLVTSGVPILQALNITRDTAGNVIVSEAITKVHDSVKEGESIVAPLEASGVFPPMVISMIEVGEETGQLPEMLAKIADNFEDEVDNAIVGLTSLIEPILIVFLALVVGTIVIGMFMPLIGIINNLTSG
ncbi:MAG: type II secretion system F family protein [Verrucomicrobiota bacterium]|nr:type II secretion system F family protein [Verrucomicrobiota bacterium]